MNEEPLNLMNQTLPTAEELMIVVLGVWQLFLWLWGVTFS